MFQGKERRFIVINTHQYAGLILQDLTGKFGAYGSRGTGDQNRGILHFAAHRFEIEANWLAS
jgi:hypothetical protein